MENFMNAVPVEAPKKNYFKFKTDRKMSCDMGSLIPAFVMETLPSDDIKIKVENMMRFAPLIAPVMHQVDVFMHYFFVPNRIQWANWKDFITGGDDGLANPASPYVMYDIQNTKIGSIPDYLGLPCEEGYAVDKIKVSAFPFNAYAMIWNEYYRDQNLQDKLDVKLTDGNNTQLLFQQNRLSEKPFLRAWEHDYFTSCLPYPQKGPAVSIPLGTYADIVFDFEDQNQDPRGTIPRTWNTQTQQWETNRAPANNNLSEIRVPNVTLGELDGNVRRVNGQRLSLDVSADHKVDLSSATSAMISDLREAYALQRFLEKNARGGSRYDENTLAHFGVQPEDYRISIPEYIGGGKQPVAFSEVAQTSGSFEPTANLTPQGNLAGHGISAGQTDTISYKCKEHGYIIGILSIRPKTAYSQGVHPHWTRYEKLDYFWPDFANIGEQPVKNIEIFAQGTSDDNNVFGYLPYGASYRTLPSTIHGDFRKTLEYWHLGRRFANLPALNEDFVTMTDLDKRIFAVQNLPDNTEDESDRIRDYHSVYMYIYHEIDAYRPIPKFGVPNP